MNGFVLRDKEWEIPVTSQNLGVMPVPQGYSAIDLDQSPFGLLRDSRVEMTLYEPQDVAIKDFSSLPYTEAFQKMFDIARKEYAFNGVEGKEPDWDALYAELAPRITQAEQGTGLSKKLLWTALFSSR